MGMACCKSCSALPASMPMPGLAGSPSAGGDTVAQLNGNPSATECRSLKQDHGGAQSNRGICRMFHPLGSGKWPKRPSEVASLSRGRFANWLDGEDDPVMARRTHPACLPAGRRVVRPAPPVSHGLSQRTRLIPRSGIKTAPGIRGCLRRPSMTAGRLSRQCYMASEPPSPSGQGPEPLRVSAMSSFTNTGLVHFCMVTFSPPEARPMSLYAARRGHCCNCSPFCGRLHGRIGFGAFSDSWPRVWGGAEWAFDDRVCPGPVLPVLRVGSRSRRHAAGRSPPCASWPGRDRAARPGRDG